MGRLRNYYTYTGLPPMSGAKNYQKSGRGSWYIDVPDVGRLYVNSNDDTYRFVSYVQGVNVYGSWIERVTVDVEVVLTDGAFSKGTFRISGAESGLIGTLSLSEAADREEVYSLLEDRASLASTAALTFDHTTDEPDFEWLEPEGHRALAREIFSRLKTYLDARLGGGS